MNKKKIIIIVSLVLIVAVSVTLAIIFRDNLTKKTNPNNDTEAVATVEDDEFISFTTKSQVDSYLKEKKIEPVEKGQDFYYLSEVNVFKQSAGVEITFADDKLKKISATIASFDVSKDQSDEIILKDFTDEEKSKIEKSFKEVKVLFEKFIGCKKMESYDLIPTYTLESNMEVPENENEKFYRGYCLKQYSVIDKDGVLWFLKHRASHGEAYITIEKVINTAEYENFIPNIDMTR